MLTARIFHMPSNTRRTIARDMVKELHVLHGFVTRMSDDALDLTLILTKKDASESKLRAVFAYLARKWNVSNEYIHEDLFNYEFAYLLKHPFMILKSQVPSYGFENLETDSGDEGSEIKAVESLPDPVRRALPNF